jgi:acetyl-CoA carboxylase beta subunit
MKKTPDQEQALYEVCPECNSKTLLTDLIVNAWVCPKPYCSHHLVISARQRLHVLGEPNSFVEWDDKLTARDPLEFPGYPEKLDQITVKTGMTSAALTGFIYLGEFPAAIGITDYGYMRGAMNSVVGERLARCIERATKEQLPVLLVSGSGAGAMMYEGILSLMQMPRVTSALSRHKQAGLMSIVV